MLGPVHSLPFGISFTSVTVMALENSTLHHESIPAGFGKYTTGLFPNQNGSKGASAVTKADDVTPSVPRPAQTVVDIPLHSAETLLTLAGHTSLKFTPHDLARLEMVGI